MDAQTLECARQQAEICKVFGNANRILILWVLGERELSVGDIADAIDSSLQNTSQHLRLMRDRGILVSRREQNTIYYGVADHTLMDGCRLLQYGHSDPCHDVTTLHVRKRKKNNNQEVLPMSNTDLTTIEAAKVVDARGSACPGPLLEAKKGIGAVAVGQVLEIWSGDANTKNDIPKWSQKVGHEYLGSLEADGYDRIFIKRSK